MEVIIVVIIFIVLFAAALAYGAFSWGFVMYKFWYWFLLPVFPALPEINFGHAVGLAVFIGLFHTVPTQILKKEYKDELQGAIMPIIAPWVTFLFGWVIYSFIN
jgi:hypothetical protein